MESCNKLNADQLRQMYDRGLINRGNLARIQLLMHRASVGSDITIGFLGGSITAGSLSSVPESCYAYLVYSWWKDRFPKSRITYVNGGVGATTSQFAVARVEEDLLDFHPDIIFVEFSVNDQDNDFFKETFEGLIRRILLYKTEPAIFMFNNVFYDDGHNAQRIHNVVGIYYDLPIVSMKESIYEETRRGTLMREQITPDLLHPNDLGHGLIAGVIRHQLDYIYQNCMTSNNPVVSFTIPDKPLSKNRYYSSIRLSNTNTSPDMFGFQADRSAKAGCWDVFRGGWYGYHKGDGICFRVTASLISVQYRKYAAHPAPRALAVVDGDEEHAILLDSNFDETWGDCLYLQDILSEREGADHTIEIRITWEAGEKAFYLASVITA